MGVIYATATSNGNSARLIRYIIPILAILAIAVVLKIFNKIEIKKNKTTKIFMAIAAIAGACILWSNDGGVSTYITISFVYFLILIKKYKTNIKKILLYTLMYIGVSVLSALIILAIVTRGNVLSWFKYTLGVSSYQMWYYQNAFLKENMSILDIRLDVSHIIMIVLALYYTIQLFRSKDRKEVIRFALLDIVPIAYLCGTYLYQFLSGGTNAEVLVCAMGILVYNYIFLLVKKLLKWKMPIKAKGIIKKATAILILLTAFVSIIFITSDAIKRKREGEVVGKYVEGLKGYLTRYGQSINDTVERVGNDKIFSTYASAVEVATNQYQPSGTDYIIHVLGDKQREEYIDSFKKGDFRYVATTDVDMSDDTCWIRNANWFFYKELYKEYKPVFVSEYNMYWEKKGKTEVASGNTNLNITKKNEGFYTLRVTTENQGFNGVASIKLGYNSKFKKGFFQSLDINRYVNVFDKSVEKLSRYKYKCFLLPTNSEEYYIPITIIDGVGEIDIETYPQDNTELEINNANIEEVFDVNLKYCYGSNLRPNENNTVYVKKNKQNGVILKGVKSIKIGDYEANVELTEDKNFYMLKIDGDASKFEYPNAFEVIK